MAAARRCSRANSSDSASNAARSSRVRHRRVLTSTTTAPAIKPGTLVVSLCAGLPTSLYEQVLPAGTPVVRVMPNTPMLVGEAMSAISPGSHATAEHLATVEKMLGSVGRVVRLAEELNRPVATPAEAARILGVSRS